MEALALLAGARYRPRASRSVESHGLSDPASPEEYVVIPAAGREGSSLESICRGKCIVAPSSWHPNGGIQGMRVSKIENSVNEIVGPK